MFTIATAIIWLVYIKKLYFYKTIGSTFFYIWLLVVILDLFRAGMLGLWLSFVIWIITGILFQQIIYARGGDYTLKMEYAIKAIVHALFLHLLMGLYEITTHSYIFEIGTIHRNEGHVAVGMFYNLNDYTAFLATMLPFALYAFKHEHRMLHKIFYFVVTGLAVFMIIQNDSRAALLSCIFQLIIFCYIFIKRIRRKRYVVFFLSFFILISLLLHDYISDFFANNTIDVNGKDAGSDIARINLILNGLYFLKLTHGFGVGASNLLLWLKNKSIYPIGELLFIHNWYVEILVTFGILFFLLYCFFHGQILYKLIKRVNVNKSNWSINNAMLISFSGFSIASIASSSNIYSEWVWLYLILLASYCEVRTRT